jgi:hypothetical protein
MKYDLAYMFMSLDMNLYIFVPTILCTICYGCGI